MAKNGKAKKTKKKQKGSDYSADLKALTRVAVDIASAISKLGEQTGLLLSNLHDLTLTLVEYDAKHAKKTSFTRSAAADDEADVAVEEIDVDEDL